MIAAWARGPPAAALIAGVGDQAVVVLFAVAVRAAEIAAAVASEAAADPEIPDPDSGASKR